MSRRPDFDDETGPYSRVLADRLNGWQVVPILEWLATDGRQLSDSNELTQGLATRMASVQAPIVRLRLSVRDDRQQTPGWSSVWQVGQPLERDRVAQPGFSSRGKYLLSPIAIVDRTQAPYRVRLDNLGEDAHTILHELALQGASDYIAYPLHVKSIGLASIALVTDRLGGFDDDDILKIGVLASATGPTFEAVELRRRSQVGKTNDRR